MKTWIVRMRYFRTYAKRDDGQTGFKPTKELDEAATFEHRYAAEAFLETVQRGSMLSWEVAEKDEV